MKKKRAIGLILATLLISGSAGAGVKKAPPEMLIGADHIVQIRVMTAAGMSQTETHRVDGDGFIHHSMAGRVRLLNLTPDQASDLIARVVAAKGVNAPFVQISVLGGSTFQIAGEVKTPGSYDLQGRVTLQDAVNRAGGFKPSANRELIRVVRKGTTMKHIKSNRFGTFLVRGGDEIVVLK